MNCKGIGYSWFSYVNYMILYVPIDLPLIYVCIALPSRLRVPY